MDEVVRFLRFESGQSQVLPLWEAVLGLCLTLLCSTIIAMVYRRTHSTLGYSPSYAQTLVLTAMDTTLIMVVIGSNIARAFSLVGAMSIIRFRNAVKETRDVGYIFFAMGIAMACGTRFYVLALVATAIICLTMLSFHAFGFGASTAEPERLLRVRLPADQDPIELLEEVFQQLFSSYSMVLLETAKQGLHVDAVFTVVRNKGIAASDVVQKITAVNSNLKVSYNLGLHSQEI